MVTMIPSLHTPKQNRLLAALPAQVFDLLAPHMELVSMPLGDVLHESGGRLQYLYFPTSAILSLHYVMENGASSEIAGVGNEGVLGIALFMGGNTMPNRATVQTGGCGYRLSGRRMMEEFSRTEGACAGALRSLLLRYTQALMTQISQTAACNRYHSVEQQLCRWLLLTLDRLASNDLTMTQELIAGMLGVRREGITEAAGNLQRAGLIRYRRGHISVIDRSGLESRACECYEVVRNEFERLLCEATAANGLPGDRATGRQGDRATGRQGDRARAWPFRKRRINKFVCARASRMRGRMRVWAGA